MAKGHRIEKEIKIESFLDLIKDYNENDINISDHALFRLKESQRKIFKDRVIKELILNDTPILVGIQYNGNYALFYEYSKNILKMIIELLPNKIEIVTFYILDKKQLPRTR